MSIMRLKLIIILALCSITASHAQERTLVRKGNELYQQKKYAEAAAAYQKALQKGPQFVPGAFNLGNALIQQKQYDAARKAMEQTVKASSNPAVQGGAFYNSGNTYMNEQKWQEAVDAYKQSLRKSPDDANAKYNLSYALTKLKQEQQQNKDDKKDQDNKDKQQKDEEGKDKEEQKKPDEKEGDQQQKQKPKPQPSKLSEQQADNLLKALQQDERKVQGKMQQGKAVPVKVEKDW